MKSYFARHIGVVALCLSWPTISFAWGTVGHSTVAWIASQHLTPQAASEVSALLGPGGSPDHLMPEAASWADEILSLPQWKSTWPYHFADLVNPNDYYHTPIRKDGDAVQALIYFEDLIRNQASKLDQKRIALKFLIHIVGDIHQPLHSGRREDRGGNLINVTWFGAPIDLHHVWDNKLIEKFCIDSGISNQMPIWKSLGTTVERQFPIRPYVEDTATFVNWTEESHALNSVAYNIGDGHLETSYYMRSISPVNQRLALAGQRLAKLLNRIFAQSPFTSAELQMRQRVQSQCGGECVLK